MRNRPIVWLPILCALALGACGGDGGGSATPSAKTKLGLFTSLPIYWGESDDFATILSGEADTGWVRSSLENQFALQPLDTLDDRSLAGIDRLMLAQPRALSASENVALDHWVRSGGRALIFADPILTRHSHYAMGDKRRPQDVVLISPILDRWGLELTFDEAQPDGERLEQAFGVDFPVWLAGTFVVSDTGVDSDCIVSETGLLAQCDIGEGRVTLLADAAMLDGTGRAAEARGALLSRLASSSLDY